MYINETSKDLNQDKKKNDVFLASYSFSSYGPNAQQWGIISQCYLPANIAFLGIYRHHYSVIIASITIVIITTTFVLLLQPLLERKDEDLLWKKLGWGKSLGTVLRKML